MTTRPAVSAGELAVFAESERAIVFRAHSATAFMLGSAVKHPHDLVLGNYSVHTNAEGSNAARTASAASPRTCAELASCRQEAAAAWSSVRPSRFQVRPGPGSPGHQESVTTVSFRALAQRFCETLSDVK